MRLRDGVRGGLARFRKPYWASPTAYLRLDLVPDGLAGPWAHLYDRATQEAIGEPTPQSFLRGLDDTEDWEVYAGPIDLTDSALMKEGA